MTNRIHVYLFGKDKNNQNVKLHKEFDQEHKEKAIDELIQNKDRFKFGYMITDKQRNDMLKCNEFYQEAKGNGGLTLFVEPTSVRQLQHCNVSLSYYKHKISK